MKNSLGISNFLKRSLVFPILLISSIFALITEEGFVISPCYYLELCLQIGISFLSSFAFPFSSFHSCLYGLLRQPLCPFAFLFLGDGLASQVAQTVKNLPTMQETQVQSLGKEDPLEKNLAPHSSIFAWRIPWTDKPGRLQSMGPHRVGHD